MKILIEKTTAAATADLVVNQLNTKEHPPYPRSLYVLGELSGAEEIEIQFYDGSNWRTVKEDGREMVFDIDTNHRSIYSEFEGRIYKPATANAVGIAISYGRTA